MLKIKHSKRVQIINFPFNLLEIIYAFLVGNSVEKQKMFWFKDDNFGLIYVCEVST